VGRLAREIAGGPETMAGEMFQDEVHSLTARSLTSISVDIRR
jgi:hypothetical protein